MFSIINLQQKILLNKIKGGFSMYYSTTDVYQSKRKIVNFSKSLVPKENKVERKFVADIIFGILSSKSVILSDMAKALKEPIKVVNTVERLGQNLEKDLSPQIDENYTRQIVKNIEEDPVILVDDSDIVKPHGQAFEDLGIVRDGSSKENKYEKGYMVTEIVGLSKENRQPLSLFSHIHSSKEKSYKSTNTVTFNGLEKVIESINGKGTFVFDRGYDMNSMFQFMHEKDQYYIIRLTERRKLFWKGKWYKSTTLRDSRKGKVRMTLTFRNKGKESKVVTYVSHLNVKVTANKEPVWLVLVYGLGDKPMILATNKPIKNKEDLKRIVYTYMSRWRIEEYFRFKKQSFGFENFRVRSLKAINNLNSLLTYAIGLIGIMAENKNRLTNRLIANARGIRKTVWFYYYRIADGLYKTLNYARTGIKDWFPVRDSGPRQLEFDLAC